MVRKAEAIVAELRRRIDAGELRPGEPLPTAKEIMAEWGVSMGPAYRALTMLRQDGLAEPGAQGRGSVVAERPAAAGAGMPALPAEGAETRAGLVRAAIEIVDAEGLGVLSMRRLAQRFDVANVWLLTYLRDKAQLQVLMSDAVFAEHPPPEPAGDRRARLEALCRLHWRMYRRRPWLAVTVSFKQPRISPHIVAHTAWAEAALAGTGSPAMAAATAANYVRGSALSRGGDDGAFEAGLGRLLDGLTG
ncbi:GntR family transcriptional regulator [Dactylosporangium sp. McL0621]|uniref:GntR family transcriptional regulator n=1 Tax=Dactylosporangium sp. McL0621 TaxID=3415678 RepID=UPI003CF0A4E1